jgi:hypothetical protein
VGLAALGAASFSVYGWLFPNLTYLSSATRLPVAGSLPWQLPEPLTGWFADPGALPELTTASKQQLHATTAVDVAVGFTALAVLYLLAVVLARGRSRLLGTIVVFAVAALAQSMAVLSPYALSSDVYSYAMYGRIYAVHAASPYMAVPTQFASDVYYPFVYWMHVPSFYGPLWTLLSGWLVLAAGDDVGLAVLLFRALAAVSALLAMVVVFLALRRTDPQRAMVGAVLVGWCPLVVVEAGLSAHNDVLMTALIVLALALAWQRRPLTSMLAVGAVVVAGLVKLTALALLPLLGIYVLRSAASWRARAAIFVGSGLVSVALAAAIVWPVWAGPETFAVGTLGSGADRYVNSLAEVALGELRFRLGATRDDLEVPLQFSGWWVAVHTDTALYAARSDQDAALPLPIWRELLVVGPEREGRLRVFDPISRQIGFVPSAMLGPIGPPAAFADDQEIQALSKGPLGAADLLEANRLIRLAGWAAFGLAFLVALIFGTGSASGLVVGWVGLCLVLGYVTLTWYWPWYALWGLMPAALVPRFRLTRQTVYLGWGVLLAYACMGFQDTRFWYVHNYRALPTFGLPLLAMFGDELLRALGWLVALPFRSTRSPTMFDARRRARLQQIEAVGRGGPASPPSA